MSDEELESLEVTDQDVEFALNPGRGRHLTKDDQIYGIWAEKKPEEYETPSFEKNKPLKFMNFISGGVSVGSRMDDKNEGEKDDEVTPSTSGLKNKDDYIEVSVFQTKKKTFTNSGRASFAGPRTSDLTPSWTSTSGKGSVILNMMKKMGYETGKGLGTNKQGIVEPVVANVRKGRGAVGAYGAEQKGVKFGESAADAQKRTGDTIEIVEEEVITGDTWKKTKKARVKYRTLSEVISDGSVKPTAAPTLKMKIIDMTGPQERTYDDINSYHKRKPVKESSKRPFFDVPALTENLNTLLSSCEQEILNTHSHLEELRTKNKIVQDDQSKLKSDIDESEKEVNRLDEVIGLIMKFDHVEKGIEPLEHFKRLFYKLNTEFSVESKLFNLDAIVQFKVLPMITRFFSRWDPLDPETRLYGFDEMMDWKNLLSLGNRSVLEENRHESRSIPTFDLLLWEGWMPQLRRAVLGWDARTNSPQMSSILSSWSSLLAPWMLDNLIEQLIVPKIEEKVTEWNPITDEIPLDEWLIPWDDMLGHRLLDVYCNVRQKMGIALRRWNPTDLSALAVIKPWSKVFSQKHMRDFLDANIVPKLESCLFNMNINPLHNTRYEEFGVILAWRGLLQDDVVCKILTRNFFSRWYAMLCDWLQASGDSSLVVPEVANYYREWKSRVPQELHQWPPIQTEFARAVKALGQIRRGEPLVKLPSYEEYATSQLGQPACIPSEPLPDPTTVNINQATLRSHIEQVARERGLVFHPIRSRSEHGRQIYNLGNRSIYFDSTAVFCMDHVTREWMPVSVPQLLQMEL